MEEVWNYLLRLVPISLSDSSINFITIILLTLTAIAGFLSSWANAKANEIKLLPLPVIYFLGRIFKDRKILIKNIGYGVAYDIKVEDFVEILIDIQKIWLLKTNLVGVNYLENGAERSLENKLFENGKEISDKDFILFHLDPDEKHERKDVVLLITFKNAIGVKYYCRFSTGRKGLKIITPARRYTILTFIWIVFISLQSFLIQSIYKYIIWKLRKPYIAQPKMKGGGISV